MAYELSGSIQATLTTNLVDTSTDDEESAFASIAFTIPATTQIANGSGANQASGQYTANGTLEDEAAVSFDFSGALTDVFGQTITWTKLKLLMISNEGTDSSLKITGNLWENIAGNVSPSQLDINPGSMYCQTWLDANGEPIVGAANDVITLTHASDGSADITYRIIALGS